MDNRPELPCTRPRSLKPLRSARSCARWSPNVRLALRILENIPPEWRRLFLEAVTRR